MDELVEFIDNKIRNNVQEGIYLELMNKVKAANDQQVHLDWSGMIEALSDEDAGMIFGENIPPSFHYRLDAADPNSICMVLARCLEALGKEYLNLKQVIFRQAMDRANLQDRLEFSPLD